MDECKHIIIKPLLVYFLPYEAELSNSNKSQGRWMTCLNIYMIKLKCETVNVSVQ